MGVLTLDQVAAFLDGAIDVRRRPESVQPLRYPAEEAAFYDLRTLLQEIVAARRDAHLHYLSGLELFGEADAADLPDGLHPNTAGHRRMGERFHALRLSGKGRLIGG